VHKGADAADTARTHTQRRRAPAPDKPCVSLPGARATSFLREPAEALEYSDQVMRALRPGRGEALPSPRERDRLPAWVRKAREDGEYCKALVGVPAENTSPGGVSFCSNRMFVPREDYGIFLWRSVLWRTSSGRGGGRVQHSGVTGAPCSQARRRCRSRPRASFRTRAGASR
jgi:hypothetical protein